MTRSDGGPEQFYRERSARFAADRDELVRRSRLLSHARVAAFAVAVAAGLLLEQWRAAPALLLLLLATGGFIGLIVAHRRTRARERWAADLVALNEQGLDRLARRWDRLPRRTPTRSIDGHAYAADLDIFGRASVTALLGPVATPFGRRVLDDWLLARAAPACVRERQDAVRELAPMHDLRDTLALHGRAAERVAVRDIDRFLDWAESGVPAGTRHALRVLAWLLPIATWLTVAAQLTGVITASLWIVPVTASLLLYLTVGTRARRTFERAFGREPLFSRYPDMIGALAHAPFAAPMLRAIAGRLRGGDQPADARIDELRALMHRADLRSSSMHLPVFLLTLWDVHVLFALERWQRACGGRVRDWLEALGEAEALAAMGTLTHDRPDWPFPVLVDEGEPTLESIALGHPLIDDDARVHNDVSLGPPGTFLLVTGSNMSGKSTLLRAIGVNAVLAQAGAPVCARQLRLTPLEIHTSIRVQDSLARGVSYFMAELERLKQIVDAADAVRASRVAASPSDVTGARHPPGLLFLLDEILHGTNTAERRIAATRVIRHLVQSGAIGAATTHDLALADQDALAGSARLVHFSETFREGDDGMQMEFDYRLRDGLATSTNALALMRMVGLPDA